MSNIKKVSMVVLVVVIIVAVLGVLSVSVFTIDTGNVGVVKSFGKINSYDLQPGINWVCRWYQTVKIINVQERLESVDTSTLSRDGVKFDITATVRYRVAHNKANYMLANLNTDVSTLVRKYIDSTVDDIGTGFDSDTLYSSKGREALLSAVTDKLKTKISMYVEIIDVLIPRADPPESIRIAIEKQQAANMEAKANKTIATTLTDELIHWKSIDKLNPQADVVYMGTNGVVPTINVRNKGDK